ncbi:TspO/MBR family protein [Aquihabitans daechungensis]|uniref:TspO/MBR family protein n=1 Tax=Aquihabitans daechungensis TaxID=1052257 RepID=UPI003BA298BF
MTHTTATHPRSTSGTRTRHPVGRDLLVLATFVGGAVLAAGLGSLATSSSTDSQWFLALDKPAWYPPSSAFGIVWTVLYVMIAASGFLAWRSGADRGAIGWWWGQMVLNLAWSVVFFGLRSPGWAMVVIVAMVVAIAGTIRAFAPVDRRAAALLLPYLAWVLFASTLNAAIVVLN